MTKKYKAVLFDYDGTLVDTNQLIVDSWNHMYMKHFGRRLTGDDVKWTFGIVLREAVDRQMQIFGHTGYEAKGTLLGIVTSRGRETCIQGLKKYGMADCFDAFVTAESTNIHKPLPEPALICCRELGVEPQDAVMIGDSVFDLQCANAAGCGSCFVTWSYATSLETALEHGKPTHVAKTPEDILALV